MQRVAWTQPPAFKLVADETTARVLGAERGRTKTGELWAVARKDRPWTGTNLLGLESADRSSWRLQKAFCGSTVVGAYRLLAERGDVKHFFCWSQARRPDR